MHLREVMQVYRQRLGGDAAWPHTAVRSILDTPEGRPPSRLSDFLLAAP